ncbi:MAG: hypothetical protein ABI895_26340 [Deltaproteobacteria bacterium]
MLLLATSSAGLLSITSILDSLLLRPPVAELVYPHLPLARGLLSFSTYVRARDSRSFAELAAYDAGTTVALTAGARRGNARVQSVNPGYFSTLGSSATQGRLFAASDDRDGAEPVLILREDLREQLGVEVGASSHWRGASSSCMPRRCCSGWGWAACSSARRARSSSG